MDNDGRVTALFLSSNNIQGCLEGALGTLPSSAAQQSQKRNANGAAPVVSLPQPVINHNANRALALMRVLDLRNNRLEGPLPPSLAVLTSIEELYLGYNKFTGKIPAIWPFGMKALAKLGLNCNKNLRGAVPSSFKAFLSSPQEQQLEYLDLSQTSVEVPPSGSAAMLNASTKKKVRGLLYALE